MNPAKTKEICSEKKAVHVGEDITDKVTKKG